MKGYQEGTSLEVLLVSEIVRLEPVSSMQGASTQQTKCNRSAPTAPTARLQHTHPSPVGARKGSQEGTSLEVLLVREIVQLEPYHAYDTYIPAQLTKFKR
jgi:hypothetical protein